MKKILTSKIFLAHVHAAPYHCVLATRPKPKPPSPTPDDGADLPF